MTSLKELVLHPTTRQNLAQFIASDSHAMLLTGSNGSGKGTVLSALASELGASRNEDRMYLKSEDASISINQARTLRSLLNLHQAHGKILVVIVENAEKLTTEAQNALLKQLEEPAENTYFLLSTHDKNALLPTVLSRLTEVRLNRVADDVLTSFFIKNGFDNSQITKALKLSNNSIGLAHRILSGEAEEYIGGIDKAKQILGSNLCEKLLMIDVLVKDKPGLLNLLSSLERILDAGFQGSIKKKQNVESWAKKLGAVEESMQALRENVSVRILLLRLMLQL